MPVPGIDHILTTTHSVRKRLDLERPVESSVIQECLQIAVHAPTGSNRQAYHFMVVTDPDRRAAIAGYYRQSWTRYVAIQDQEVAAAGLEGKRLEKIQRVRSSAQYLADNMHRVPVLVIPCYDGRVENDGPAAQAGLYGSIIPAAWSLILALRSRGLGASWTTLHLFYEREVAAILGIPERVTQAALLPVAYFTGEDFKPTERIPARARTYWDTWGQRR